MLASGSACRDGLAENVPATCRTWCLLGTRRFGEAATAVAIVVLVALVVFLTVLLPVTLLLVGILVGALALLARIASVSSWTVCAKSADRRFQWSVRGLIRSRRTMHEVAHALERGGEAALEGAALAG